MIKESLLYKIICMCSIVTEVNSAIREEMIDPQILLSERACVVTGEDASISFLLPLRKRVLADVGVLNEHLLAVDRDAESLKVCIVYDRYGERNLLEVDREWCGKCEGTGRIWG